MEFYLTRPRIQAEHIMEQIPEYFLLFVLAFATQDGRLERKVAGTHQGKRWRAVFRRAFVYDGSY